MTNPTELTQKGQQTRQRILQTAISLFTEQGYDRTTMRDIAQAADCSLGLAYRYFSQKEDLAIALYAQLGEETQTQVPDVPLGTIAERFHHVMTQKLTQIAPHHTTIAALFGGAMRRDANVQLPGRAGYDDPMLAVFHHVVFEASDTPKDAVAQSLTQVMYTTYLLLVIGWLYDRTVDQRASHLMLDLVRDAFKLVRPMLLMPAFARSLQRLSELVHVMFIGEPQRQQSEAAD